MDLPKFHPNERVDLGDIEFLSSGQLGEFQRLFTNLIVGEATKRIIDGFTFTIQSATVMQIALGKAVLAENRDAAVRYGQLVGGGAPLEGVATQNVSFSGLAVATHGIFVRFVYGDSTLGNRAFWDTITASEEIQAVSTRRAAGWQVIVATNDPGGEWSRLCDVAWDGSDLNTSSITDRRTFLFEGPADSAPQTFRPTWGGGSDRNAARATHGVKTLERFASAVLKKIEEIQSDTPGTRWWEAPAEPLSRKVSRFGDSAMAGDYLPAVDDTHDIGSGARRWAELHAVDLFGDSATLTTGLTTLDLTATGDASFTGTTVDLHPSGTLDVQTVGFDIDTSSFNFTTLSALFTSATKNPALFVFDTGVSFWNEGNYGTPGTTSAQMLTALNINFLNDSNGVGGAADFTGFSFRLGSVAAQRDGFTVWAHREADDEPVFTIHAVVDETYVTNASFELRPDEARFGDALPVFGPRFLPTSQAYVDNALTLGNLVQARAQLFRSFGTWFIGDDSHGVDAVAHTNAAPYTAGALRVDLDHAFQVSGVAPNAASMSVSVTLCDYTGSGGGVAPLVFRVSQADANGFWIEAWNLDTGAWQSFNDAFWADKYLQVIVAGV